MRREINCFIRAWKKRIKKIEQQAFDKRQQIEILEDFMDGWDLLPSLESEALTLIQKLYTDLNLALNIAYSNYIKEKRGFLSRMLGNLNKIFKSRV